MSMLDWARREVEIACKRERGESGSEEEAALEVKDEN